MDTFTETPVEELTPLDIANAAQDLAEQIPERESAALELLRRVRPADVTEAAESTFPNYGNSFMGALVRTYGYLLAVHYRIKAEPDIDTATLRTEMEAHRAALTTQNARLDAAYDVIDSSMQQKLLTWFNKSWELTMASHYPDRDTLIAGIRRTIDGLWPLLAEFDEEFLGITGSDGGTTP